jgi:hypothetical protein
MFWRQGGWTGSLRRWVANEVRAHARTNPVVRAARYSASLRCLRAFLAHRSFASFIAIYVSIALALLLIEISSASFAPELRLKWIPSTPEIRSLLKDAANYYISAQVGALGILSIAIGLVTLIAQRQNSRRQIQIYYYESLAPEIAASCTALLVVLCLQLFWPAHLLVRTAGLGIPSNDFESLLTAVHTIWLAANLTALAHFIALSLGFVQPAEREKITQRYTANWVVPNDLTQRLLQARYLAAGLGFDSQPPTPRAPTVTYGYDLGDPEHTEIQSTFKSPVVLHDVRLKVLAWVVRRWLRRCNLALSEQHNGENGHSPHPQRIERLVFTPSFDRTFSGKVAWCKRQGNVVLTPLERHVITWCFRFRKASQ